EAALHEGAERGDRLAFVRAVCRNADGASPRGGEQQQAHDALAVDFPLAPRDADVRRERAGRVDELRRGPRVQPERVLDRDAADLHYVFSPLIRSEATQIALRPCSRMSRASVSRSVSFSGRASFISIARFSPVTISTLSVSRNVTPRLAGVPPNM